VAGSSTALEEQKAIADPTGCISLLEDYAAGRAGAGSP
jgi:hypothetical protein